MQILRQLEWIKAIWPARTEESIPTQWKDAPGDLFVS